jgi:hypothetical protein
LEHITRDFSLTNYRVLEPDEEMVNLAVRVYAEKIHCQPLPLFRINGLASRVRGWPQYLLLSFVALVARFSPGILSGQPGEDRLGCHRKARRDLMVRIAGNDYSLEIMQSLSPNPGRDCR